jgi:hypothetical protein
MCAFSSGWAGPRCSAIGVDRVPGTRPSGSVLGARYPALGVDPVPGPGSQVPGTRDLEPGTWHLSSKNPHTGLAPLHHPHISIILTEYYPPCPTALLPYCPIALLPYCPIALLPYCLTALLPDCPTPIPSQRDLRIVADEQPQGRPLGERPPEDGIPTDQAVFQANDALDADPVQEDAVFQSGPPEVTVSTDTRVRPDEGFVDQGPGTDDEPRPRISRADEVR